MANPTIRSIGIVDVQFGNDVTVVEPVNLYGCRIGDGTFVGPFVEIQCGARVGGHCRIQSHAFICDMVEIGDHCFISHGVMFINDTFGWGRPAGGDRNRYARTAVGDNVSIGTNATILPVTICDDVVVGAGSVVTRDIDKSGVYAGNPARFIREIDNDFGV